MLNKEKWAKEIVEFSINGHNFGVVKGEPRKCCEIDCAHCELNKNKQCYPNRVAWANAEYVERHPCANCKVDDKVLVRDYETAQWYKQYFAKIENGLVYCFRNGATSWSNSNWPLEGWKYGKPYVDGEEP